MVVFSPEISVFEIHPASIILLLIYYAGNSLIQKAKKAPMWYPRSTIETVQDKPNAENLKKTNLYQLWFKFAGLAIIVGLSGYGIAELGISIAGETGLSEGLVGSLFTAMVTSFPELIVTIAAIRQGALTLAVANIIGGNSFDILFLSFTDIAYRDGSLYHAFGH
jgi:cation:H+ antiporter